MQSPASFHLLFVSWTLWDSYTIYFLKTTSWSSCGDLCMFWTVTQCALELKATPLCYCHRIRHWGDSAYVLLHNKLGVPSSCWLQQWAIFWQCLEDASLPWWDYYSSTAATDTWEPKKASRPPESGQGREDDSQGSFLFWKYWFLCYIV